ncbi:hypothetical protein [Mycobacteroides abscessus]|uniref:hypothetical protein n=1 Tax=Mycobacteroides abscessus TaxID=36809 RepID=UPI0009A68498|nr:hypothetical protein [Mycobacteroides abscessus]MDB2211818.1 hypothetical protein [Mycobacteroides abscessus subsp. massiliense]MDB2235332.1 hypothetical protein [Mycobacteroides abscessus subsp. massiliense]WJJ56045.1 hypothetical protein PROPHIT362B_21 [Mycobacterium phage prophiT36-2b]SKO29265.1 Uncharacterised protein [Mycobacteroides abscessus subsp. massiliense]
MNGHVTLNVTTEVTESHVITLLANGQPIGTVDLRRYMPRRTKLRLAISGRIGRLLARLTPWAGSPKGAGSRPSR